MARCLVTRWMRTAVVVLCGALIVTQTACTSFRPLPDATTSIDSVVPGDRVQITKKNGDVVSFTVDEIDASQIKGDDLAVARDDIQAMSVRRFSGGKTLVLTVAILAFVGYEVGTGLEDTFRFSDRRLTRR